MTNFDAPKNAGDDPLQRQIEAVFTSSPEAARYADFLEATESAAPLTEQDYQAIHEQIIDAQAPVAHYVAALVDDEVMRKILMKMMDPNNPDTCSDMAEKLVAAYRLAHPGSSPSQWVLRDVAMLDTIEEITWYTQPTEETAPHLDKSELQSRIIINPHLSPEYRQALLAAADALVSGNGLDFSDPVATFAAVEKKARQERSSERARKFRRQFNMLGRNYGVEHDPEFHVLTLVTSLAIIAEDEEFHIPSSESVYDSLRLLGIPYGVYANYVQQILSDLAQ